MKFKKTVYLKRYDEKTQVWSRKELKNVLVSAKESYNLSDTLNRDAQVILRVMGDGDADVLPLDVILLKNENEVSSHNQNAYTVTAVCKNNFGSNRLRHTKVLCK